MEGIEAKAGDIFNQLVTTTNVIIVLAVYVILTTLRKVFPELYYRPRVRRLVPLLPTIFGIALNIPRHWREHLTIGTCFLIGLLSGFTAAHLHDILGKKLPFLRDPTTAKKDADSDEEVPPVDPAVPPPAV